jgi:hypothetical protein
MEELLSQSARAFLLGAGASCCTGLPQMAELTGAVEGDSTLTSETKNILAHVKKQFDGCANANLEDYMSEIIDALAIADRRQDRGSTAAGVTLEGKLIDVMSLRKALTEIKSAIAKVIIDRRKTIDVHRKFVGVIHNTLRAGKTPAPRPVDYFVLNYDTLIEDALGLEKLPYTDGFSGGTTAWWDALNFERTDIKARVLKLHGSIDWCRIVDDISPRRLSQHVSSTCTHSDDEKVLIWPAATKYIETQKDPFSQMLALLRKVLRQATDTVLTICGYGFGDKHINAEIDRAIREGSGHLTLIVLCSTQKPEGQLSAWLGDPSVGNQVRVYARGGFFHGKTSKAAKTDLPWWKFEVATRLLGGER